MNRSAVFVDAGYLYAQGSAALAGSKLPRAQVTLNLTETIDKLRRASDESSGSASLLRIYWYDGLLHGELSAEQQRLAFTEDVKLRLGVVTPTGQQKGVDSLIVTDLVELARNHAITDAVLLSGDEDLRIGVQIAQSFGVRVHLIGIEPSRGSQSVSLLQEADTTTEWSREEMRGLLNLDSVQASAYEAPPEVDAATTLEQAVDGFMSSLEPQEVADVASLEEADMIPHQIDGRLLATCRRAMGRYLNDAEMFLMRSKFKSLSRRRRG